MIKNRTLGHIGLGTNDIEATVNWYINVLGFKLIGSFQSPVGEPIRFIQSGDIIYEIFQPLGGAVAPGKIDHFCFESSDIEADTVTVWNRATPSKKRASRTFPPYGKRAPGILRS